MEFRLLGPLEVSGGDRAIPLGGPKQRTVLAHLLLGANSLVTVERLIDALWGDDPPMSARNTLQTYIKHLRKLVGAERIEHLSSGYRFEVDARELDMLRFESLVDEARQLATSDTPGAVSRLREAMGLWRGPALDDLSEQPSLRPEIARLEEMRTAAIEERMAADLALGRHRDLIPELEAMLARQPYRERSWGHLMVALYRSGRQGDALATYLRARDVLSDELGIDPSPELQHLQEQILKQDPGLETEGETLRGYRLLEQLGEGAFGVVHRAYQPDVGREVAVKVIHPRLANHPEFIRRFTAEAQLVARLEHPHIVPLYDYWRDPDGAYLVMRYLRGGNLREAVAEGPLDLARAVSVTDQIARALAAAHRQGVVHRDVQPANVLFDEDGNAYLSDFGIAKDLATAEVMAEGGAPGEFAYYMSPEEARGDEPTQRADIYSLGLVFYECLAGRNEFGDAPADELLAKRTHGPVPPLSFSRPDLPASLDPVVAKAVAEEPADRYPDTLTLVAALREALGPASHVARDDEGEMRNPYKGLRAFLEADAADFFGREGSIDELLVRMKDGPDGSRLLAVVGPSGCGKSSLVRAGLVPALRRGGLPGSESWFSVDMHPGEQPFDELASTLSRLAIGPPSDLSARLAHDRDGLRHAVDEILPAGDAELVLVIDQFEETFTLVTDDDVRMRFLDAVVAAATAPGSRVRIVLTLRADFYDRPLLYKKFGDLLAARTYAVTPLSASEIEVAVSGPAGSVGVAAGPGLIGEVVADVAGRPGALPLLQFALTELFEERGDATLTLGAYRALGGVSGALARGAEELYEGLSPDARDATRQLFLRLVELGEEGSRDTRRRALRSELTSLDVDRGAMGTAIDTFGSRRLLTFDRDPESRAPTVEVAHEALLSQWGRLRGWIEAAREDIRVGRHLAVGAVEWERASRDASFLLRGANLQQAAAWSTSTGLALARPEREYLDASLELAEAERAVDEERRTHEIELERRSVRRLRALVAMLSVAALVAATLTVVATNRGTEADRQARIAGARELAAAAVANVENDQQLSVLLAIEAVERTRSVDGSVLREAEEALHRTLTASMIVTSIPGSNEVDVFAEAPGAIDWGPQGLIVIDGIFESEGPRPEGIVDLRDAETGRIVRSLPGHDGRLTGAAFSADGSMLATTGTDRLLKVWDLSSGQVIRSVRGPAEALAPSFSADGSRVAAAFASIVLDGSGDGVVRVVDLNTDQVRTFVAAPFVNDVALSPDGTRVVSIGGYAGDADLSVIDVETGKVQRIPNDDGLLSVAWSPDGRFIAAGGFGSTVLVTDADGRSPFMLRGHSGGAYWVDWNPDGNRLVTGSEDGSAKLWGITGQGGTELQTLTARAGAITGVAFSPDGTRVVTGSETRVMDVWDVGPAGGAEVANIADAEELVSFTSRRIVTSRRDGSLTTLDLDSGELSHSPVGWFEPPRTLFSSYDFAPDGEAIHVNHYVGPPAAVRDVETGGELFAGSKWGFDWSPDGSFAASSRPRSIVIVDRAGRRVGRLRGDGFLIAEKGVRLGPDGLVAIQGTDDQHGDHVKIWDWTRNEVIAELPVHGFEGMGFEGMRFDSDGSTIAIGGPETTIWDVRTGRLIRTLRSSQILPADLAFSPDGARLAEIDPDGTVRLFDTTSGEEVLVLRGHDHGGWVAFSPDGSMLATVGGGIARIWALDIDDLLEIARENVTRSFSDEECSQYLHVDRCPS